MRLHNKIAWVTGGASGIGAAICERFAQEGATVVVADLNLDGAAAVAQKIVTAGGQAKAVLQDVTDEKRWAQLMTEIIEDYQCLNILVNNAGIAKPASVEDETLEGWRSTQAVNLDAVFLGTRAAIAVMKKTGGSIVNISSIEGMVGEPLAPAYNASKGGVRIFTKSAALHCASSNYPIRINSLHPGYVNTAMVQGAIESLGEQEGEIFATRVLSSIPMQRLAEASEIANGALFLASDEASYMTGSELVIDGGYTAK